MVEKLEKGPKSKKGKSSLNATLAKTKRPQTDMGQTQKQAASEDPFQKGISYLKSNSAFSRPDASTFRIQKTGSFQKKYVVGQLLGEGSYGTVHSCVENVSKAERSVKFIKREKNHNEIEASKIMGEIAILSSLDHPNIAQFYEVINETTRHCIVSEYCKGGDLMESLDKYENFNEQDAGKIIKRLLSAINYCHEKGIIHRDLKPENLMFEGDNCPDNIKVIDFGESLFSTVKKMVQQKNVGSLYYMAPEMMLSEHNQKCDLWSIGVIAYFLLSGDMAFFGDTAEELKACVIAGEYDYDSELWNDISKEARDFIDALLTKDIDKRLSAEQALHHPWISKIEPCTSCPFHKKASETILKEIKEGSTLKRLKTRTKRTEFQQCVMSYIASQSIEAESRERIGTIFKMLDTTGTGHLTQEQLWNDYEQLSGKMVPEKDKDVMFKDMDTDGNGTIEYSEFVAATMKFSQEKQRAHLRNAFNSFDLNGDGFIDRDEILGALKLNRGDVDMGVFEKTYQSYLTEGKDSISFDEFCVKMEKILTTT